MESTKEKIKYHSITERWGNDAFCRNFSDRLDKWLNQFSKEERPILISLLKNFYYYTSERIGKKVIEVHKKLIEVLEGNIDVVYARPEKDFEVSFSDTFFQTYWVKNGVRDYSVSNLCNLIECDTIPPAIVIIDDYSGSGDTIIKYIKKLIDINIKIKESKLYLVVLHISEDALKNLKTFASEENICLECVYLHRSDRAFKHDVIFNKIEAVEKKEEYSKICKSHHVNEGFIFGYKQIEALVAFEESIPNNTLGIFWHELDDFVHLFKRHKRERTSLNGMIEKAKQNKNLKGQKPILVIKDIEETKINQLLVYCFAWGKSFSVSRTCYDFGLTSEQFDNFINEMLKAGYLEFKGGAIVPSDKIKNALFTSRLKKFKKIYYELKDKSLIPEIDFEKDTYLPKSFADKFNGYKSKEANT